MIGGPGTEYIPRARVHVTRYEESVSPITCVKQDPVISLSRFSKSQGHVISASSINTWEQAELLVYRHYHNQDKFRS